MVCADLVRCAGGGSQRSAQAGGRLNRRDGLYCAAQFEDAELKSAACAPLREELWAWMDGLCAADKYRLLHFFSGRTTLPAPKSEAIRGRSPGAVICSTVP